MLDVVGLTLNYMGVTVSHIRGYPDEAFQDFEETVSLSYGVPLHALASQLHYLSPPPIYEQHHEALAFDDSISLEICNGAPLHSFERVEGFDLCLDLIKSDKALFAPYRYFESPEIRRKLPIVERSRGFMAELVGDAFVSPEAATIKRRACELRGGGCQRQRRRTSPPGPLPRDGRAAQDDGSIAAARRSLAAQGLR